MWDLLVNPQVLIHGKNNCKKYLASDITTFYIANLHRSDPRGQTTCFGKAGDFCSELRHQSREKQILFSQPKQWSQFEWDVGVLPKITLHSGGQSWQPKWSRHSIERSGHPKWTLHHRNIWVWNSSRIDRIITQAEYRFDKFGGYGGVFQVT